MAEVPQQAYPVSPVFTTNGLSDFTARSVSFFSDNCTSGFAAGNESTFTGNNVSAFTTLFKLSNTGLTASCAITDEDKIIANVNNEM